LVNSRALTTTRNVSLFFNQNLILCVSSLSCGVCGGDGSSCVPAAAFVFDACGVCGGTSQNPSSCSGLPLFSGDSVVNCCSLQGDDKLIHDDSTGGNGISSAARQSPRSIVLALMSFIIVFVFIARV